MITDPMCKQGVRQAPDHDLAQWPTLRQTAFDLEHVEREFIARACGENDLARAQRLPGYDNLGFAGDAGELALENATFEIFRQCLDHRTDIDNLFRQRVYRPSELVACAEDVGKFCLL